MISGFVSRLPSPSKPYGFSINENGWYVSSQTCQETGGHWNPTGESHGPMNATGMDTHAGDLSSLRAGSTGSANYYTFAYKPTLWGENSIIGKSMVVYSEGDDFGRMGTEESRLNGGLDTPIACCHIKLVQITQPSGDGTTTARTTSITTSTTTTTSRGGTTEQAGDLNSRRRLANEDDSSSNPDEVQLTPEEFADIFGFLPDADGDDGDLIFGQD